MTKKNKLLWTDNEWNFERLDAVDEEIKKIAVDEFGLDCYPNQVEVISSEQMMDAYTSHGLPVFYHHWSFGKNFTQTEQSYKRGQMGLAYEIVINSNPAISYLMEENTMTMQALVIAHAAYGHNSFFKNNYLFKLWTNAESIVDYLIFAKKFIAECEFEYGQEAVEEILDSAHALMNHGVDKYKRPKKVSKEEHSERMRERARYRRSQLDDLWKTIPKKDNSEVEEEKKKFLSEPQENILYFIEKNAPNLEDWQRELVRIVRMTAQYFYPQMQTKVMNEGWASFWHYTIMYRLWEKELISDGSLMEVIQSHSGVLFQPDWDETRKVLRGYDDEGKPIIEEVNIYNGLNPYYLGFNIFKDIKRICEEPTEEDKHWFPHIAGKDWLETIKYAMENFKDDSFILQYLSPKVIRDMKLFILADRETDEKDYNVDAIQNESGYKAVREALAAQYNIANIIPDIAITDFDLKGERTLFLRHTQVKGVPLEKESAEEVVRHIHRLWGFDVVLDSYNVEKDKVTDAFGCIDKSGNAESGHVSTDD